MAIDRSIQSHDPLTGITFLSRVSEAHTYALDSTIQGIFRREVYELPLVDHKETQQSIGSAVRKEPIVMETILQFDPIAPTIQGRMHRKYLAGQGHFKQYIFYEMTPQNWRVGSLIEDVDASQLTEDGQDQGNLKEYTFHDTLPETLKNGAPIPKAPLAWKWHKYRSSH